MPSTSIPWSSRGRASIPTADRSISQRSNYALRESLLDLRRRRPGGITAVSCCGANPGMVSWFVKQALLDVAAEIGLTFDEPKTRDDWARLMQRAGVKGIHIAERDTQRARDRSPRGMFVNTWSVEGFCSEGLQPAELGWGTHEKKMPANGRKHEFGCDAAIYLTQPGAATRVRSWTPTAQAQHAFLVTHNESISIADYFTLRESGEVVYRPTCHYAYHPCDDAVLSLHEMAGARMADAAGLADPRRARHRRRHRRARRAALRPRQERLLVWLAAVGRRDPRSSRPTRTRPDCRSPRPCSPAWCGCWKIPSAASSRPTRWISGAAWKSSGPISGR